MATRRSRRDPARSSVPEWDLVLLDRYGRGIQRESFRGSAEAAKRAAARLFLKEHLTDHVIFGVVVKKGGS